MQHITTVDTPSHSPPSRLAVSPELSGYCGRQQANTEFLGGDLSTNGVFNSIKSLEACCELCRTNWECGAYTLNLNDLAGVCKLKLAAGYTQRARGGYYSAAFNRTGDVPGAPCKIVGVVF